jgi:hypothetical protein
LKRLNDNSEKKWGNKSLTPHVVIDSLQTLM